MGRDGRHGSPAELRGNAGAAQSVCPSVRSRRRALPRPHLRRRFLPARPRDRPAWAPPVPPCPTAPAGSRAPPRLPGLSAGKHGRQRAGKVLPCRRERGRTPRPGKGHLRIPAEPPGPVTAGNVGFTPAPRLGVTLHPGDWGVWTHGGWQSGHKAQRCLCPIVPGLEGMSVSCGPHGVGSARALMGLVGNEALRQPGQGWTEGWMDRVTGSLLPQQK